MNSPQMPKIDRQLISLVQTNVLKVAGMFKPGLSNFYISRGSDWKNIYYCYLKQNDLIELEKLWERNGTIQMS